MKILIIGALQDPHVRAVKWGLTELGIAPVIWTWADFPKTNLCSMSLGTNHDISINFNNDGFEFDAPFDVIWMRRRGGPAPIKGTHVEDVGVVLQESEKYIDYVSTFLGHCETRWINSIEADRASKNKIRQLIIAKEIGFVIPDTVIGNDAQQVRNLFERHQGKVVHKGFSQARWENSDGSRTVTRTSALNAEHLKHDYSMRACPGIYQELIQKSYELRVTVIGQVVIAAAIYSQEDGPTIDWRCEGGRGHSNLRRIDIEPELAQRCLLLCQKLNISFGCLDLIVTKDGDIVFLEVNSAGQFLFKEVADPSLLMLDSFCKFLAFGDDISRSVRLPVLQMANYEVSDLGKSAREEYRLAIQEAMRSRTKSENA